MGDILLMKVLACRKRIEKIRTALPSVAADVLDDEKAEAFIAFSLFLLIQDAVDLAAHLVAERGLGVPGSLRETFETLAKAGIVSPASATAMGQLASLRNRIAHSYGDLDPVRLVKEAPVGLDAAAHFLDEIVDLPGL